MLDVADLPVYKRDRSAGPLVLCNGSLHFHNLLLVPPGARLGVSVEQRFRDHEEMYLGRLRLISHLDVRLIIERQERVVDYAFKIVLRGRVPRDEGVLLLPKVHGELASSSQATVEQSVDSPFTRAR